MNFKNNIERCKAAISMGYSVQMTSDPRIDHWGGPEKKWRFDARDDMYRVYPEDEQAFQLQLAARRDALDASEDLDTREPVLQDIDQYKKQMAHIRAATFGHWTEDSSVHPDYDTIVLRNVARLYAKYDALCKKATSTEDLLIQLKRKLGPRVAITVNMNPEL